MPLRCRYIEVQGPEETLLIPLSAASPTSAAASRRLRLDEARSPATRSSRARSVAVLDDRSSNGTFVNGADPPADLQTARARARAVVLGICRLTRQSCSRFMRERRMPERR